MAVWDPKISWCFMLLLADAVSDRVNYPGPVCAVKGSTVTIPCTFTHPKSVSEGGREVSVEIIRVLWCQNHEICQGITPAVYDSDLKYNHTNNPRYRYLGDKKGDCSLQITDVQKRDDATLRFRMEAHTIFSPYTGPQGVKVTVTDGAQMEIRSSVNKTEMREGEAVTLNCTSGCSFHQLEVTWLRDGHALKHTGPSLYLGALTAQDSGNYTCGLKNNDRTLSKPFSLYVEAEEEEIKSVDTMLAVRLIIFTLHSVLIITVTSIIIKRTCVCKRRELKDVTVQPPDFMEEL